MIDLLAVSLIWAFSFGLIKDNLTGIDPNLVSCIRLFISFVLFLPFVRLKGISLKFAVRLALLGAIQYGLMYISYTASFRLLKAYEVALFTIFTPIYVTLLDDLVRKRVNWLNLATAAIAVFGTGLIEQTSLGSQNLVAGFLIVQASNLCFAIGQVGYKRLMAEEPGVKDQHIFGLLYFGAFFSTAVTTLVFVHWQTVAIHAHQILSLVYLGAVASGLGFFLWNHGARRVSIGALAIINNLKIPLAVVVSLLVFGEKANLLHLFLGGVFIIVALGINQFVKPASQSTTKALKKTA